MSTAQSAPVLTNTMITVTRTADGTGNVSGGRYHVVYGTAAITDQTPNAILCYQLTEQTPPEIRFVGVQAAGQGKHKQLSAPSISRDGRVLTLIDADSAAVTMQLTFKWRDSVEFEHDPQIGNVPHG